ncbi:unnamed protein product [Protopolystoma xenopodis]|uniref:Uncharacterized protein n=1 Tax=Protopolystoma xenopodis TaxID=117903 RepID=A0A3S5A8F9_9PLAT|nr:unnamed protein product [Protopolystoma xenopodis]
MLDDGQGMCLNEATGFLLRITYLADFVVFGTGINLSTLEKDKNMATGGILRQCLRLG